MQKLLAADLEIAFLLDTSMAFFYNTESLQILNQCLHPPKRMKFERLLNLQQKP